MMGWEDKEMVGEVVVMGEVVVVGEVEVVREGEVVFMEVFNKVSVL